MVQTELFAAEIQIAYSYKYSIQAIKTLESDSLSTVTQISILKDVILQVNNVNIFNDRLDAIIERNPDLNCFTNFNLLKITNTIDKLFAFILLRQPP